MISRKLDRVRRPVMAATNGERRFGPWPWYLTAADSIGLDVALVDDIVGDMAEECAGLSGLSRTLAQAWCVGQAVRALPYLAVSTLRRGQPRARLRFLGAIGAVLLTTISLAAIPRLRLGPPARIAPDLGFDASDIVINNRMAVQMPIGARDAHGRTVPKPDIRYEQVSGDPLALSPNGAVSCWRPGDAVVRASVNHAASLLTVHCRPVTGIHTSAWHDFLPGDPPQTLRVEAVGADGRVVSQLRGSAQVVDTNVVTLHRGVLTPHAIGSSRLTIAIGEAHVNVTVNVHEMVERFDNLAPAQRNVAMRLRLATDDTLHIPVPAGALWVKWLPLGGGSAHPAITAEGAGYCHMDSESFIRWAPAGEYAALCYVGEGTRIRVARSRAGDPVLTGALLLERLSR